jgi:hypothetical protein
MSVKIFDTHALQTDVLFNTNKQPNQQRKKKTKINSRHPPSIPTLPYAAHTATVVSSNNWQ